MSRLFCQHKSLKPSGIICPDCQFLRLPVSREGWAAPDKIQSFHRIKLKQWIDEQLGDYPEKLEVAEKLGWPEISDQKLIWLATYLDSPTQKYIEEVDALVQSRKLSQSFGGEIIVHERH